LFRRLTSWGANTLSRLIAGLSSVKDCTGGFRAIRASALRRLNFKDLSTPGYAFQITTLYELMAAGASVSEVPITFRDRKVGQTKITAHEYVESFKNLIRLRLKRSARLVKFGLVGASGIVVNEGLLFFLVEGAALGPLVASPIAIEASIISNFLLNTGWTFRKSRNRSPHRVKFLKFQGITLVSLAINYAAFAFLHAYANMHYLLANLFGIVLAFFWNYFVNVRWTWREP